MPFSRSNAKFPALESLIVPDYLSFKIGKLALKRVLLQGE